ncbi:MAG: 2-amino-4-hydroxy-6-hydroxymethyldihydropteridine diphosphokinase [Lachnospiraceae bacterium]|nr:2-amino-4-hydroxy-6-hydroxymethyldihydropteridine diphosphokinase [Lachnospiraceae bacterium]
MDEIRIENLEVYAYHGRTRQEKEQGQVFYISAVLYTDLRPAGLTDQIERAIDYGEICDFIARFMRTRTYQLIETVIERLAEEILLNFSKIKEVKLEIRKQSALAAQPFEAISAMIHRSWHTVYLSFSSNFGDRESYINQGIVMLKESKACKVEQYSDVFVSGTPDNTYYSGVLKLRTLYTPWELRDILTRIEERTGRIPNDYRAPRTLDLDILFYDDQVIQSAELCVPHIDMENRDYVLIPLAQIAGFLRHPATGKSVKQMAEELMKKKE